MAVPSPVGEVKLFNVANQYFRAKYIDIQIKRIFLTNLQELDLVPKEGLLSSWDHRAALQICCLVDSVSCQENKWRQNVASTDKK